MPVSVQSLVGERTAILPPSQLELFLYVILYLFVILCLFVILSLCVIYV